MPKLTQSVADSVWRIADSLIRIAAFLILTKFFKNLQKITKIYKNLQIFTKDYKNLQNFTNGFDAFLHLEAENEDFVGKRVFHNFTTPFDKLRTWKGTKRHEEFFLDTDLSCPERQLP